MENKKNNQIMTGAMGGAFFAGLFAAMSLVHNHGASWNTAFGFGCVAMMSALMCMFLITELLTDAKARREMDERERNKDD